MSVRAFSGVAYRYEIAPKRVGGLLDVFDLVMLCAPGLVSEGEVEAGIRQGCPLSPYIFVIVLFIRMALMWRGGDPSNTWSVQDPTYDVEYAALRYDLQHIKDSCWSIRPSRHLHGEVSKTLKHFRAALAEEAYKKLRPVAE